MVQSLTQEQASVLEIADLKRVGEEERQHTATRDVLWLWFATNLTALSLAVGLLSSLFGLGFWGSVRVIVCFTVVGAAPVAYFSTWGPKTGLVQMVIARFSFGWHGAKIPAGLNAFTGVGWLAFNTIIGADFLSSWSAGKIPMGLALALLVTVTTLISLFGYFLLQRSKRWVWLLMALPLGILLVVVGPQVNIQMLAAPALTSGLTLAAAIATFGGVVFAHVASWGPLAADVTRRMPVETSPRRVFSYNVSFG